MSPEVELELLRELKALASQKQAFLDDSVTSSDVQRYLDVDLFNTENSLIHRQHPKPLVHSSELPEAGCFVRRQIAGLPLLVTRDSEGVARAFLNVCRHRGTRLVDDQEGCRKRFTCPYHAWTWNVQGELVAVPHQEQGFPDLDRSQMGLKQLACEEEYGWIWVCADREFDVDASLGKLHKDFSWFDTQNHVLLHSTEIDCHANWKILAEGGLEAYHFRVAHRNTIAPYFLDNLSSYQVFGNHIRSILAKKTLVDLDEAELSEWRVRNHAQVLYTLLPSSALLVQSDHISWIDFTPQAADRTLIRVSTLAPRTEVGSQEQAEHWLRNHKITVNTLQEDFDIGESIQAGLGSGANSQLTFGRFEGALAKYNEIVESALAP